MSVEGVFRPAFVHLPRWARLRQSIPSFDIEHSIGRDAGQGAAAWSAADRCLRSAAADSDATATGGNSTRSCQFRFAHEPRDLDHHPFALFDFLEHVLRSRQPESPAGREIAARWFMSFARRDGEGATLGASRDDNACGILGDFTLLRDDNNGYRPHENEGGQQMFHAPSVRPDAAGYCVCLSLSIRS